MIVHFIGGPRDGEREALSDIPRDRIQIPYTAGPVRWLREEWGEYPRISEFDVATYTVTRRARYAIAEYVEPKVTTRWAVELRLTGRYDSATREAFHRWLWSRRTDFAGDVRWVGAQADYDEHVSIDLLVTVDGPADPDAIRLAAEKVSNWLHREVPAGVAVLSTQATTD